VSAVRIATTLAAGEYIAESLALAKSSIVIELFEIEESVIRLNGIIDYP
jgi:hypothetical protein